MAILVPCPTCASKLRVPEQALGKRVKCPKCNCSFAARSEDDSPADAEPEERVTERPPVSARGRRPAEDEGIESAPRRRSRTAEEDEEPQDRRRGRDGEDDEPVPASRRRRREEEPEEPEEEQEAPDDSDEPPPERRKKKKKRRKYRQTVLDEDDAQTPAWVWWTFGGGGVALIMSVLLGLTIFLSFGNSLKFYAAYMLISLPISTVIFFAAMFLSSVTVGAMEIGEIHVTFIKAFILVFLVNLVSLLQIGFWLPGMLMFIILLAGLMTLFRLDVWEARVVLFFHWVLNYGLRWFLMAAVFSWTMRGGGGVRDDEGGRPGRGGEPAQRENSWDPAEHDGEAAYDDNDNLYILSFPGGRAKDAYLAHMKEFPGLVRLDLKGSPITDKGLQHLKACKNLRVLILTGTKVTEAGVRDLQQALPGLAVER